MLPTKFRFIWPSSFRGEDLKKSANQKQELPVVAMFVNGSGKNVQSLERTAHRCFLPSFGSFGKAVSEKIKKKLANQKQELPVAAMFVNISGQNEHSLQRTFHRYFLPSFSSFGREVSEEKIKMWKVNERRMPSDGKSSHCLWQGELKMFKLPIMNNNATLKYPKTY